MTARRAGAAAPTVWIINPNTTAAMTAGIERCARAVAAPTTTVVGVTSEIGPASIESHYDEAVAVPGVLRAIERGEREGVDGYVIACFGDPGLDAARELATGPVLGLAVPDYVDVRSITELKDHADRFGRRIMGIEAGAGLMRVTRESAMPGYGLEDWELVQSSTPTMLAELDRAIQNQEWIVVTLWRPHWAFAKYDIRYLDDPQGLMNPEGAEQIQIIAREGFRDDFAEVAAWLGKFKLTSEQLARLEAAIQDHGADQPEKGVQAWLEENRDVVDAWLQ